MTLYPPGRDPPDRQRRARLVCARALRRRTAPRSARSACARTIRAARGRARHRAALGALRQPARRRRAARCRRCVAPGGSLVHFVPAALGAAGLRRPPISCSTTRGADAPARACMASTTSRWAWRRTSSTPGSCSAAPCSGWSRARASSSPIRSGWSAAAASPPPTARVRFVLNVSLSQRTRTARTVAALGGGARCITSPSPAPTSSQTVERAARAAASRSSPISANYYDDLPARFDLDAGAGRADARARHALRPRRRPATTCTSTPRASPTASSSRSCSASELRRLRRAQRAGADGRAGAGERSAAELRRHLMTTTNPCIITVAITGSLPKKADNPAVPITLAEQVESTQAGVRGRRDAGPPARAQRRRHADLRPERFAAVLEGMRKHCPGMIVQVSTGGRSGAGQERGGMLSLRARHGLARHRLVQLPDPRLRELARPGRLAGRRDDGATASSPRSRRSTCR